MKHVAILNVFTHREHSRSTLTPNWFSVHCTTTVVYCRCPHRRWLRCQVDHRCCFQDSLCSFLPLAIFFIRNDDCKNGNVYLVMGRRARFQSIWKICIVPDYGSPGVASFSANELYTLGLIERVRERARERNLLCCFTRQSAPNT